ncbi:MAG: hypothetical protein V1773_15860 [bacterium]
MPKITLKISKSIFYVFSIIIAISIVIISIELLGIYNNYLWKVNTKEKAEAKLNGLVNKIQKVIFSIEQIPQNLAYVLEFSNPKQEHLELLLNAIVANNDEVFGTCIAFEPGAYHKDTLFYAPYFYKKDGKIVEDNPSDTNYNYFSMDWYLIPKTLNKPVWLEPYYDEGFSDGDMVLSTYSVPFYYFNGQSEKMTGIVSVDISLEWLSKMILSTMLTDGSYSFLISDNGTVISAPNPQWLYNESIYSLAEIKKLPVLREIGRDLKNGKSGFVDVGSFGTRKKWWIFYKPIPANNWGVLLLVPQG